MRVLLPPSLLLAALLAAAHAGSPAAATVTVRGTTVPGALRVTVTSAAGAVSVPASPYVVVKDLAGSESGPLCLRSPSGKALLTWLSATSNGKSVTIRFSHDPADRYYGEGNQGMQTAGPLIHVSGDQELGNGKTRIPFIWSPAGYGILAANHITDITAHIRWSDAHGVLTWVIPAPFADLYLMAAKDGYGVLNEYAHVTGPAPIPPRWAFGYLQSRWGYKNFADIEDKWRQFRDRKIPIDGFIYDYDWFTNDWEFSHRTFPDPAAALAEMHAMNLHFIGIRKPRANGANLDYARAHGWILSGSDLRYDLPDFRQWWWSKHAPLVKEGIDGWWNDEAENAYDEFFYMSQQEYLGGRAITGKRQWSVDRAFAPGTQHYGAAAWTGDIQSTWESLGQQPGTLLNWTLAGMPYVTHDTGGFGGPPPSPELYTRWMEEAVFIPVMRSHGGLNSPRWPWAFGDAALAATKKAIEFRYRLIPYLYTLGDAAYRTGAPLMRPLFLEFPDDSKTWNLEGEWLLGARILAAPVLSSSGTRTVYLPAGEWFDGNTGQAVHGDQTLNLTAVPLDVIPFYVRAGSIVPLGPVIQSTAEPEDPLEIRIYPGTDATFTLYEDEGDNYHYEKGAFTRIPMHWNDRKRTLTMDRRTGSFPGMLTTRHLAIVLPGAAPRQATYTGDKLVLQL